LSAGRSRGYGLSSLYVYQEKIDGKDPNGDRRTGGEGFPILSKRGKQRMVI